MGDISTPDAAQRALLEQEVQDLYAAMREAALTLNTVPAGSNAVIDDAFETLRKAYWSRTPEHLGAMFPTRWRASDPDSLPLSTTE